jgi:hypothetical protein
MRTQDHKFALLTICIIGLLPLNALSQTDSLVIWKGCISAQADKNCRLRL